MEKREDTSKWLKFFKDAGIPTKTGASYALIFVENRINIDMLSDLTVDYLRLMGIKLMGDIIAILRHCKTVHQDSMRKVVILKSKEEPAEISSSLDSSSSSADSSSSSDSEDERRVEIPKKTSAKKVPAVLSKVSSAKIEKRSPSPKDEVQVLKSKVIGKMISSSEKKAEPVAATKRKYAEEKMEVDHPLPVVKTAIIKSDKMFPSKPSAPLPKKMKVVSDNEYFGPKLPPVKKTVFDRLGAENDSPQVSSTTEVPQPKPEVVETKFTRIISNVSLPIKTASVKNVTNSQTKGSSVFDRLGGQNEESPSAVRGSALQYAGILKSPPRIKPKPLINIIQRVGTMRADEPQLPVKLRTAGKPVVRKPTDTLTKIKDTSLKARLKPIKINRTGLSRLKAKSASEGIFANPYKEALNVSAKERLGLPSNSEGKTSTNKKLIRPSPMGTSNKLVRDRIRNSLTHHLGMSAAKKVSFGRVEERTISPARSNLCLRGRNRANLNRSSVHSRLGVKHVV